MKALREGGEFLLERLGEDKADAPPSIGGTNLSTERSSAEPRESGVDIAQGTAIQLSGSDVNDSPDTDVQPTKPVVQT